MGPKTLKQILVIHPGQVDSEHRIVLGEEQLEARRLGVGSDVVRAEEAIRALRSHADVIAVEGFPVWMQLGLSEALHQCARPLLDAAGETPLVDGSGVRRLIESWAVELAERGHPGLFRGKRVLMLPGLNHVGLAHALERRGERVRYADPLVFFGLPRLPGVGSSWSVEPVAPATLNLLSHATPDRLAPASTRLRGRRASRLVRQAEVIAGDVRFVLRLPPRLLRGKTVVVETAREGDLEALGRAGARICVCTMPCLEQGAGRDAIHGAATVEAVLAASVGHVAVPPSEDQYLDRVAELEWSPAVHYLQPEEAGVHRFAFVVHPLDVSFLHRHPLFRWTRPVPEWILERVAAYLPPMYLSRITGGVSALNGQRVEGLLFGLGATPRQILRRDPRFTYRRLTRAARMAEARGARLIGLGAFTSVVGDAGITVARDSPIAVTSGNSLTVAATLEAAKLAVLKMGEEDLSSARAMVIGATGSIGSVCARMIAQAVGEIVLVSIEPEKLIQLKRKIRQESPGTRVRVATRANPFLPDCDVIVTATSGFGQRVLDISLCKPGAIICDVARPPDVTEREAALRPDVLVIESGEVVIPGEVDFGYDIGLPPGVSYACLAETALLAMAGRFENYTLGRSLDTAKVKEIYKLFRAHGFRLAGLRSLGRYLTDEELAEKRRLADRLREDASLFEQTRRSASEKLSSIPPMSKGVRSEAFEVSTRG